MSHKQAYYSGGLAELVSDPSLLTYSFFSYWMTGKRSVGSAMKLLELPVRPLDTPLLAYVDHQMLVDLAVEEETLYAKTLFRYALQTHRDTTPKIIFVPKKLFSLPAIGNSFSLLMKQAEWIGKQEKTVVNAQKIVDSIPEKATGETIEACEEVLIKHVWPQVIAVGMLAEFFHVYLEKEVKQNTTKLLKKVSSLVSEKDFFFLSLTEQEKVKTGELSFSDYLKEYGLRADNDYELTEPRWKEMPEVIKKRITQIVIPDKSDEVLPSFSVKTEKLIKKVVQLQLLRSEAKRRALVHVDHLRVLLMKKVPDEKNLARFTRDEILSGVKTPVSVSTHSDNVKQVVKQQVVQSGQGRRVSAGIVTGIVKNIADNFSSIPEGTIGIFPNASPQFAMQFPKCAGMIFLQGGLTSHGSIVAREFGIPALIDSTAAIPDGTSVTINGETGEWRID